MSDQGFGVVIGFTKTDDSGAGLRRSDQRGFVTLPANGGIDLIGERLDDGSDAIDSNFEQQFKSGEQAVAADGV